MTQKTPHNLVSSTSSSHIQHVDSNTSSQNPNHVSVNSQLPETGSNRNQQLLTLPIGSIITISTGTITLLSTKTKVS